MLVIDIIFHRWISVQFPLEYPLSYVDDWQIRIAHLLQSLENFTQQVDLQLDAWCTGGPNRETPRNSPA